MIPIDWRQPFVQLAAQQRLEVALFSTKNAPQNSLMNEQTDKRTGERANTRDFHYCAFSLDILTGGAGRPTGPMQSKFIDETLMLPPVWLGSAPLLPVCLLQFAVNFWPNFRRPPKWAGAKVGPVLMADVVHLRRLDRN